MVRTRLDPGTRRAQLLEAAAEAFAAEPYAEVKTAAIASRAGASEALLYRYFPSKEQLYAEIVGRSLEELLAAQRAAVEALPEGVPVRDRLRASLIVHLDHLAGRPYAFSGEPAAVAALRHRARRDYVDRLVELLAPSATRRHAYAMWGWLGFVDAACLRWVEQGCPPDDRWSLIDAALGALEGALGDWAA